MAPLTPTQSHCSLDSLFDPFMDDDVELFLLPFQTTKRKRVRINAKAVLLDYVEHVSELTQDDRLRGWWTKEEYAATKLAAKARCRELRRRGAFEGCLTDAYEQACSVADSSVGHDDLNSIKITDELAPRSSLLEWCSGNESSRGLERWSSKVHGFLRGKHVGQVKHVVLLEQARQFLLNETNDEGIARISADASRRSRAFARLLGEADAVAVTADGLKRDVDDAEFQEPHKVRKTSLRSSPTEPIVLDDEDSDEDPKSPPYIDAL